MLKMGRVGVFLSTVGLDEKYNMMWLCSKSGMSLCFYFEGVSLKMEILDFFFIRKKDACLIYEYVTRNKG